MAITGFWQLGSAGMLAWGVAATVPIVIHLLSRRRYREEPWAAMTFLLAALRKNARRIQLQQWILLAVRTAVLLLFALALADPRAAVVSPGNQDDGRAPAHVVLVMDDSYSMNALANGKTRLNDAKELATQQVESSRTGNGFTLVLMGKPPRAVIAEPAFDRAAVLKEIDAVEVSHGGADLGATLDLVEATLRDAASQKPRLVERRVCFITDLQRTTWDAVNSPDIQASLARLKSLASLEMFDLQAADDDNLAASRLEIDATASGLLMANTSLRIEAEIQSFAREDRAQQSVEVLVDGQRIADERVDVPAGGRTSVAATHRFETAGDHVVEVRLADDVLALDNRRWLIVPVRETVRVLCVGPSLDQTRYAALALAPRKDVTAGIEVIEGLESRLLEDDLAQFDCLIVCNLGRFSREEARLLHSFVSRGGGLITFLGDQVDRENYNALVAGSDKQHVLPARLEDVSPTSEYRFDPLDYRHAVVAPFRGFMQSGLVTTPVWKYVRVRPIENATTVLGYVNGDPTIVEGKIGLGRSILVTTAAAPPVQGTNSGSSSAWTALPTWPSFPPLVHEMLRFAIRGQSEGRNVLVGDDLTGNAASSSSEQAITLRGPEGIIEPVPLRRSGDEATWTYRQAPWCGVYESQIGESVSRYVVNLATEESDLTQLDPERLPSEFHHDATQTRSKDVTSAESMSTPYFRWLLAGVLALLIVETGLAWQFGRERQ